MSLSAASIPGVISPVYSQALRPLAFASSAAALKLFLLAGCAASVALAAWVGDPDPYLRADPELAFMLRGMVAIKLAIVLAAAGAVVWRFGHPVTRQTAAAYLVGMWLAAGATMLVWQLSFIPLAALTFHVGEFTLLFAAWRDHGARSLKSEKPAAAGFSSQRKSVGG